MLTVRNSQPEHLPDIARCHMACFPSSLSTRLGSSYVQKSLEWFLVNPNRFLFHVTNDNRVVGYCGGFMPVKIGDGSSSGMLQHAFNYAVRGLVSRPYLLFHAEVRQHYPFLLMNLKRKLTGKAKPIKPAPAQTFEPFVSLVVIGVLPEYRGQGIAQQLMAEFEKRGHTLKQHEARLSVKKDNARAIKAYNNFGWSIKEEHAKTYVLHKLL